MGYHLRMENEEYLQHEDLTYALVEGSLVKEEKKEIEFTPYETTGWHLMMEDDVIHLGNEDGTTRLLSEQELAANNFYSDKEIIKYETTGYHLKFEDDGHIIWENATEGGEFDNSISRMVSEEDHVKSSTRKVILELLDEILAFEDGSGYFITEGATPNRIMVTPAVSGIKSGQSSYMAPTLMTGGISIAANSTTVEGSATTFITQFSVGDVFQTSDENVILEDSEDTIILETLEIVVHEDITVAEVASHVINGIEGLIINTFKWYIGSESSTQSAHAFTPNVLGSYVIDRSLEQFNILDEATDYGKYIGFEDDSGVVRGETTEFSTGIAVLLETGDKMVHTEKGEFKVAAITDDDTLTVTRKHWEGTDYVPFWKQTTEYETTAVVAYK